MNLSDVLKLVSPDLSRSLSGFAPELAIVATIVLVLMVRVVQRSSRSRLSGLVLLGTLAALVLAVVQLMNLLGAGSGGYANDPVSKFVLAPLAKVVRVSPAGPLSEPEQPMDLFTGSVAMPAAPQAAQSAPATEPPAADDSPPTVEPPRAAAPMKLGAREGHPRGMLRFDGFTVFFRIFLLSFTALVIWLTTLTGIPDNEDAPDFYTLLLGATLGMSLMASANHLLMVYIAVEMASLPSYAMAGFLKGRRDASEASLKYVVYGAGASGVMLYGISLLVGKFGTAHIPTLASAIAGAQGSVDGVLLLGLLFVLVGVAFKISAVPFHFWCPDVFEGAAAEVAGFLSVASKAAALALLARLTVSLTSNISLRGFTDRPPLAEFLAALIGVLAAITATYGNLAAYAQTNLKRLLAFSTIAHAGYMMMPVAAALAMGKAMTKDAQAGLQSLVFYLMIYQFMNLGAFAVVALIRNQIRSENLGDYVGLSRRNPFLAFSMAVFLLSLTGIPPLAGFAAKWSVVFVLFQAKMHWLVVVLLANTIFSAFYYVKVLRAMYVDPGEELRPAWTLSRPAIVFCGVMIAANFIVMPGWKVWDAMDHLTEVAVLNLLEPFF